MKLLTQYDLTKIFNVSVTAINEMVDVGLLSCKKIDGNNILFCPNTLITRMEKPPDHDQVYLDKIKDTLWDKNPDAMQYLQKFGSRFDDPVIQKRHYLEKVKSKKLGFVLYVRYIENGIVVPTHFSTKTNNYEEADRWAVENREKQLAKYYNRDTVKKPYGEMYTILRKYYTKNSEYLKIDVNRGKSISDKSRGTYHNFIIKQFIPYLKKNGIKDFEEIDVPLLARFQNQLLEGTGKKDGVKPQTIKIYFFTISTIFNHLIIGGHVKTNPFKSLVKLKIKNDNPRGCYEITRIKGVFNKAWKDQLSHLLCMVIYTTGMRNSEIERIRVKNLIVIDKVRFIDITESKTRNGIRKVPLHEFVYRKIMAYVRKTGKTENDLIFKNENTIKIMSKTYETANAELAGFTGYTQDKLEKEYITFYSGRHFWKTLMDSEKLGDIEEYFMGHKVSGDVAKRYNHKDKQGRKKLVERAKRVLSILDKRVFR